jgi:hypothetical protein
LAIDKGIEPNAEGLGSDARAKLRRGILAGAGTSPTLVTRLGTTALRVTLHRWRWLAIDESIEPDAEGLGSDARTKLHCGVLAGTRTALVLLRRLGTPALGVTPLHRYRWCRLAIDEGIEPDAESLGSEAGTSLYRSILAGVRTSPALVAGLGTTALGVTPLHRYRWCRLAIDEGIEPDAEGLGSEAGGTLHRGILAGVRASVVLRGRLGTPALGVTLLRGD